MYAPCHCTWFGLSLQQMSVLPVPLAMGLDMAMTHPGRVCLVELLGKGKNKGQTPKAGKGQKGSGRYFH